MATSSTRRLLVILHGARQYHEGVQSGIQRLREEHHDVTVMMTRHGGDYQRIIDEAVAAGPWDTVVAAGGDGTLAQVVEAMLQHREILNTTSIALLPLGTCNSFAATTGIPTHVHALLDVFLPRGLLMGITLEKTLRRGRTCWDAYEALKLAADPSIIHEIDIGLLNGKVFMNTATVGASAEMGRLTSSRLKKWLGPAAFFVTGVRAVSNWKPARASIRWAQPSQRKKGGAKGPASVTDEAAEHACASMDGSTAGSAAGNGDARTSAQQTARAHNVSIGNSRSQTPQTAGSGKGAAAGDKQPETAHQQQQQQALPPESPTFQGTPIPSEDHVVELKDIDLLNITAANNRQIGTHVVPAPEALLDDGMLDIVCFQGTLGHQVAEAAANLASEGLDAEAGDHTLLRVPWMEAKYDRPIEWSLDGEADEEPRTVHKFEVLARAIKMHLPDDRLLVSGIGRIPDPKLVPRGRVKHATFRKMFNTIKLKKSTQPYYMMVAVPLAAALCMWCMGIVKRIYREVRQEEDL